MNKPFDWEILLSRIKYLLEQKKDRQQEFFKAVVLSPENITISSPDEKLMKRALEVFEKNMDNSEYSIEEFSRDMGMSRNNLYRKIKAITGESPTDFLNSVRLKQAAVLLKEGHMNVNEIAYAVGFSTHSYFTQSFKKCLEYLLINISSDISLRFYGCSKEVFVSLYPIHMYL